MESRRALAWSARYFLITAAFALVGVALVGVGLGYGGLQAWELFQQTGDALAAARAVGPYLVLGVLGIFVWRFGKAFALYMTLTGAMDEQLADSFDTEHVKSDIVAILDDRLADMQQDLQSVNRQLRDANSDTEFEFDGE
ncbi:hypothetical protein [Halanaeroarchaeum sulfurireducens]|uniref:Uncharacterized protein n=1 Tax=Halanaeroarchaeum sulfurireducens TaxID=1604004 RepID=A0A0F7PAF9_9EURY|nr:hypothetical protein [Halanaeroarchaeum sulfurireducens]AKH97140.1 hypothetical protein HLASF_0644 [Halanaeroarchaeum sulfurireducens]